MNDFAAGRSALFGQMSGGALLGLDDPEDDGVIRAFDIIPSKTITVNGAYTNKAGNILQFNEGNAFLFDPEGTTQINFVNEGGVELKVPSGTGVGGGGVASISFPNETLSFLNKGGASFTITTDSSVMGLAWGGGPATFVNDGVFDIRGKYWAWGVSTGGSGTYANGGTFRVDGFTDQGGTSAYGFQLSGGGTVKNTGTIQVNATGNGIGQAVHIFGSGGLVNSGTITVTDTTSNQSRAVWMAGGNNFHFTNSGTIKGDSALEVFLSNPVGMVVTNTASGVMIGTVRLESGGAFGNPLAYKVVNAGKIVGDVLLSDYGNTFDGSLGSVTGAVRGGFGDDYIIGGAGADTLIANDGDGGETPIFAEDKLFGGGGADILIGNNGRDLLHGEAGDDLLYASAGTNLLDGGTGSDTITYANAAAGVTVDLAKGTASGWGGDMLVSIERVIGSKFDDNLTGDGADNVFTGGGGNDKISGGSGSDVAVFDVGSTEATWTYANGVWTVTAAGVGTDSLTGVEILRFKDKDVVLSVPKPAQLADYNGDGAGDLMFRNSLSGQTVIWYSAGAGTYTPVALIPVTPEWSVIDNADFNGDGRADLLWRNTAGEVVTWDSTGNFITGRYLGAVPTSFKFEQAADFTGDGEADILWRSDTGVVTLWTSGPGNGFGTVMIGVVGAEWKVQAAGDFNGDGKDDVFWRDAAGNVSIWSGNGGGFNGAAAAGLDPAWTVLGSGDFNGDGKDDLVMTNAAGQAQAWYGASSGFASAALNAAAGVFEQIADMNGDGRDDIVWRAANGDVVVWTGGAALGQFSTGTIATIPTEWQIF